MQRRLVLVLMAQALTLFALGAPASAATETPTLDMKIRGSASEVVAVCGVEGLILDGSGTVGEDRYFVSIQKSDRWWRRDGEEVGAWFSGDMPADLDLADFARQGGLKLEGDSYYRVTLAVGEPRQEVVRLLHLLPATVEMWINGRPNPELDLALGELTMNGRYSFCETGYFVAMQRSDKQRGRHGTEYKQWFDGEAPSAIDLAAFWESRAGEPLKAGCYLVKLAVAGPWAQAEKLVCLH